MGKDAVGRIIFKYQINKIDDAQTTAFEMPEGAQILSLQTQNGYPTMWVLADPNAARKRRAFRTYVTGDAFLYYPSMIYVGTCQLPRSEMEIVVHVFENTEP